jgi:hypothetical protein
MIRPFLSRSIGGLFALSLCQGASFAQSLPLPCPANPHLFLSITGNPDTKKADALYWNWTSKDAYDFHVIVVQKFRPGNEPKQPEIDVTPFGKGKITHEDTNEGEGDERVVKRTTTYTFEGSEKEKTKVAPGSVIKVSANDADASISSLVAVWTDKDGKEIDRGKTSDGMMSRESQTKDPPTGANDFHVEYKDIVGGVWVQPDKAKTGISAHPGDDYPYQVDFTNIQPPFDFSIDFASESIESTGQNPQRGPRPGRSWWTQDGKQMGKPIDSG